MWGFRERTRAVLVMSDRDARRKLTEHLLSGGVVDVVADVGDGRQAVSEARRLGRGAVVLDSGLLKRFGSELIQEIKAVNPSCRILVLAGSESARARALREGADQAILRPRGLKKLAFGIGVALGRQPAPLSRSPAGIMERVPLAQGVALAGMGALLLLLTPYSGVQALGDRLAVLSLAAGGVFFLYALKYYVSVALILLTNPANGNGNGHSNGNGNGKINGINGLANPNGQRHQGAYQPFISVHLPVYNEPAVIDRLISACTSFDYDRYEVIVADDSQDETSRILDNRWASHPRVKISRRKARVGFKGAALQLALQRTDPRAEFVVVFDADFIPPPDILQQFLTYFYGTNGSDNHSDKEPPRLVDDRLAAVQGYQWHVLNASENWITRGVRTEYSGSYVIERSSQQITGAMRMIAGSVFMIRADVMRQLGWGTSITEDWDLTLRLYQTGYKVVYTPFVQAPAECVASIRQLARQRMRWAEGHTYNIKKHLMGVLLSPHISWPEKLEFLYFAPYYLQSALFIVGTLSWLIVDLFLRKRFPFWPTALGWSLVFTNALSLIVMNLVGLFMERGVRRNWGGLMSFVLLTYLLVPFQAYAALKGLFESHEGGWHRTQKTGVITDVIEKLGLRRKMRGLLPKKKKKGSIDIGRRLGFPLARLIQRLPAPIQRVAGSGSLGLRLASGLILAIILISILSGGVPFVSAAPDAFYLHDSALNDGKMMDLTTGSGASTMTFDTPSQSARWYTDLSYPTGADDAGIAAGDYTLNLYFDQLPTLASDWYDADWLYRKKVTIDHTKVAANQTDFPVLVSLSSDAGLASSAQNAPTAGYDILFTEDDGLSKVSHEIERFDDTTGELVAWVEVPTLSSTADTELYMYYGNASAVDQQDASGTWSNGFLEVWHLDEASGNHTDSTSNGYTGTLSGNVDQDATGQIDGADEFLGPSTTTYLTLQDGDLGANDPFSLSAWFYLDTSTSWAGIVTKGRETGNDWIGLWANGTQYLLGWDWQGTPSKGGNLNGSTLSLDTWYYGVATFDGTNRRLYLNNALDAGPSAGYYDGLTGSYTRVANDGTPPTPNSLDGTVDEVRLSSSVRDLSWIQTEYNNQGSPSTFFLPLGSEEGQSSVDVTVTVSHTDPDGSSPATITTTSTKVNSATANPLALDLGSGSAQTFTAADPQRLRVQVEVDSVTGSGAFDLSFDSSGEPTSLETPSLVAPENSLVLLLVAILIPLLTAAVTSGRRLGVRLVSVIGALVIALALLAGQIGLVSAAPDAFYLHATDTGSANWYGPDWNYRSKITVDGGQVSGSADLSYFPVLVSLTDSRWADTLNGGHVVQSDGGDILFTSSDGTTKLDHQIESYDNTTGALVAWVEFPTLSALTDTDIYIYYGNGTGVADQWNVNGTWDEGGADSYVAVWHLHDDFEDSTSNGNTATNVGTTDSGGEIADGQSLDGSSSYLSFGTGPGIGSGAFTTSFWFKSNQQTDEDGYLYSQRNGGFVGEYYFMYRIADQKVEFSMYDGSTFEVLPSTTVFSDNQWHLIDGVKLGDNQAFRIYVDGALEAESTGTQGALDSGLGSFFGWDGRDGNKYFDGDVDEIRVAGVARSPDWIATEYNNQSSPSTFFKPLDSEETQSISPAGEYMNTTLGSGGAMLTFNAPAQVAYWYTDLSYPTGQDDATLASGAYSLEMYFDQLPDPWWNSFYLYRQQLTVTNNDSIQLGANTIASFSADTQQLIGGGKLRSDGNDWRVVYWNGSGWAEIAQHVESGWNTSATETWFRLQTSIDPAASDGDYYVYYGYATEAASPSTFNTSEESLESYLVGDDQSNEAIDWNATEWGAAQGVQFNAGTSRYWQITRISFYQNEGSGSTSEVAGFVFDSVDSLEGDEIANGKSDAVASDTFSSYAFNDLSWAGAQPKVETGQQYYIAILPTTPSGRNASTDYFRWDYDNSGSSYRGGCSECKAYGIAQSGAWGFYFVNDGADRVFQVYGREAANNDLSAALGGETDAISVRITVAVQDTSADGSDSQPITSTSTVIDSNTTNPLMLDLGSGAPQTFTQADPRRLRLRITVDQVNGGGSFSLAYDSATEQTNLETPSLVVPDTTLLYVFLVVLIPIATFILTEKRRRRLAARLFSLAVAVLLALGLLSRDVISAVASPDAFYLHDASKGASNWYDADWSYRQKITIDQTQVGGSSDLAYFPVLINMTEPEWADTSNGGEVAQSDGGDILFTASDGTTKLDHEIERYTNTSGELIAWVEVPGVSTSADTDLYIYYGNSTGVPDQWDNNGTWDEGGSQNFRGVWHLSEASGSVFDSTLYGTSGSVTGTVTRQAAGPVGYAYDYGTDGQVIVVDPVDGHLDFGTNSFTVSMWLNVDQSTGNYELPLAKGGYSESYPGYAFELNQDANGLQFEISDGSLYEISPVSSTGFDTWYYLTGVVDRANDRLRLYVDGSEVGAGTDISSVTGLDSDEDLDFALDAYDLDGLLDEVRVATGARTPGWIATEYNNQSSPSAFFKPLGIQETQGVSPAGRTMDSILGTGAATLSFDTNGQSEYWYTDISYPTGQGDATIDAGIYTMHLYFDQLPDPWWDTAYAYRKQVTVNATDAVDAGYSVSLTFDHQALVNASKSQSLGQDIRIVHFDGSTYTELDRVLEPLSAWDNSSTQIWFALQDPIAASGSDNNYYLYYGNSGAAAPPSDWANVFLLGDDFNDGTLSADLDTSTAGTASISETGGTAFIDLDTNESADAGIIVAGSPLASDKQFAIRNKMKLISGGGVSNPEAKGIGLYQLATQPGVMPSATENPLRRMTIFQRVDTQVMLLYLDTAGSGHTWNGTDWVNSWVLWGSTLPLDTYHIFELVSDGTDWFMRISNSSGTVLTTTTPVAWADTQDDSNPYWFYWGEPYTDYYYADQQSDWVYVRDYVASEPGTALGSEEDAPYVDITIGVRHTAVDGSDSQPIVGVSTRIDANTSNPLDLSLGSGLQQTFTQSDPRLIRLAVSVDQVHGGGRFDLAYDSSSDPANLETPNLTVPEASLIFVLLALFIPILTFVLTESRRRRMAARLVSVAVAVILALGLMPKSVIPAYASPDMFYLHDASASGVSPSGKTMDLTVGSAGSSLAFDSAGQDAYWYSELSYPTGADDASIASGDYTLNMYLGSLPSAGLLTKLETFSALSGTGTQTISTTGFQPKAVMFWITDQTSTGSSANSRFGRGWTDGTNQAAAATVWDDGSDNTEGWFVTDKSILLIDETQAVLTDASIVSLNSNGFTIDWTTAGGSRLVTYLALGGPSLTDVKVGNKLLDGFSSTEPVTGIGFQPDAVLMFGARDSDLDYGETQEGQAFGVAVSTSSRHTSANRERNNGEGYSGYRDNEAIVGADDLQAPEAEWDIQSFDADGFTLVPDLAEDMVVSYMAFEGVDVAEGILTQPTSTGDQTISGLSFEPSVLLFDGGDKASVSDFEAEPEMIHGVATSSSERGAIWIGRDGTAADTNLSTSAVVTSLTAGTPSVDAVADFASMNSDGFSLDWTNVDSTQRRIGWVALGPADTSVDITVSVHHTAADGSDAQLIAETSTTIDGSTSTTLALDLGSGSSQTFTAADPRLLRVQIHVDQVHGADSFGLDYDSTSEATNLETPTITVPDVSLPFIAMAILLPLLAAALTMNRKTAVRVASLLASLTIALGLLASQVGTVTAAPDVFYLHDDTAGSTNWYDTDWGYRRKLTIDSTQVSGTSDLSLFPVLVDMTMADWADTGNGGRVVQSDGGDLLFTASDGVTKLDHEIESYDNASGALVAWVEVPTVSYDTDTDIYLYYGNSVDGSNQWNIAGTWSNGYAGVWHLNEDPSGTPPQMQDSTSNGFDGTSYGDMTSGNQVSGQIAGSLDFDGSDDRISVGSIIGDGSAFTVSAWFNTSSTSGPLKIFGEGNTTNNNPLIYIDANENTAGDVEFCVRDDTGTYGCPGYDGGYNDGDWHYLVGVQSAKNSREMFVDSISRGSDSTTLGTLTLETGNIGAIARTATNQFFQGGVDEVRISSVDRSSGWIATEFNNQDSPSSFFKSIGPQETGDVAPAGKTMSTTVGSSAATLAFDTPGQNAYWYSNISYPTGNDDASIAAGNYTLNLYFDSLPTGAANWYDPAWGYRKMLTIDSTQVADNLSNYTVLVSLPSDSALSTYAQGDGGDILFTSSDGTTKLAHEIERFVSGTGELLAWVNLPSLSSSADADFYMYYGNPSAADQWDSAATWDGNYVGVWHLDESGDGTLDEFVDSTGNSNDGTGGKGYAGYTPTQTTGPIGYGQTFDGTNDFIDMANSGWAVSDWPYRKRIVIQGDQVSGTSDLRYFPVLIDFAPDSDNDLKSTGNGGHVGKTDGTDVFFTNDEGAKIDHEIEKYDPATGELIAWVEVPELYAYANSTVYMYYGYASATDQQNVAGTWDGDCVPCAYPEPTPAPFESVYHLHNDFADSSGNQSAATNNGSSDTDGVAGDGQSFNGSSNYINTNFISNYASGQDFTWEGWFKLNGVNSSDDILGIEDRGGGDNSEIRLSVRDDQPPSGEADSYDALIWPDGSGNYTATQPISNPDDGTWHYAVLLRDGTTGRLYYDGSEVNNGAVGSGGINFPVTLLIGAQWYTDASGQRNYFEGDLDEIRTSTALRSPDWIATQYTNISSPSTFYQVLSEEQPGDTTLDVTGSAISLEAWIRYDSSDPGPNGIMMKNGWADGYRIELVPSRYLDFELSGDTSAVWTDATLTASPTWHHVVATYDGSTMREYVDGQPDTATTSRTGPIERAGKEFWIGHGDHAIEQGWSDPWKGEVDEVRVSTTARTAQWIETEYNNQVHQGTGAGAFIKTLSAAESAGSVDITVTVSHTATDGSDATTIISKSATIDSGTSDPLVLDLGSAALQTFTSAGPRLLRVLITVDAVTGGGSFTLAYDSSSDATSLDTPSVTVPDFSLSFLALAILIPLLAATLTMRRRTAVRLLSVMGSLVVALGLLSAQVGTVTAAPDVYYLHDSDIGGGVAWYDSDWGYRKKITVDAAEVSGSSNFSYFPVLVSLSDAAWADTGSGGKVEQSDGGDILFTASDGTTKLDHEIERYDNTTGALVAWVEVPTLLATADTELYIYYGNGTGVADQWNISGTWDEGGADDYAAVWHLDESPADGTAGGHADSTGNGNDGTPENFADGGGGSTAATGPIDGADSFAEDDDYVTVPSPTGTDPTTALTISAWIDIDGSPSHHGEVISRGDSYALRVWQTGEILFYKYNGSSWINMAPGGIDVLDGDPHYIVGRQNASGMALFVDGTQVDSNTDTSAIDYGLGSTLEIGRHGDGDPGYAYLGIIDEVRVSTVGRSSDWIATEYNNQSSPSTFFKPLGSEETPGVSPAGKTMNTTLGAGAATLTLDTPGQNAYWYTDISYPTGQDDASIVAGDYTLNMYFDSLPSGTGDWYDTDWGYRKSITIDSTQVSGLSDLSDFPVLIDFSPGSTTQVSSAAAASSDDAEEHEDTTMEALDSSDLELVLESDNQIVGMRFPNLAVPQGANITNAYIQFTVDETGSTQTDLTFHGELTGNAAAFTSSNGSISGRTQTSASVDWNSVPAWSNVGDRTADQQSPDLSSIIEEVVGQGTWSSGNALVIIVDGSGKRVARSWDYGGGDGTEAELIVEYETGADTRDPDLRDTSNGGHVVQTDGGDILFTDVNGVKLDHEIEYYDSTTGELVAWVEVPTVSYNSDTEIYLYYGNSVDGSNQWNTAGTWDEGGADSFVSVWHLDEDASGTGTADLYQDSTVNANHGDDQVTSTGKTGVADGGQEFIYASSDSINIPDPGGSWDFVNGGLDSGSNDFTMSIWAYLDSSNSQSYPTFFSKGGGSSTSYGYWFNYQPSPDTIDLRISDGTNRFIASSTSPSNFTTDEWHYVTVVFDRELSSDTAYFYLDGSPIGSDNSSLIAGHSTSGSQTFNFGNIAGSAGWTGHLDEARIAQGLRTADWIATEFNNQDDPESFYNVGNEQTPSGGSVDVTVRVYHTATDGSDPQLIVASSSTTIDSNTADPLALSIGSGTEQTFTAADPRLLRVQITVDSVSGGDSFTLAYDSASDHSSLDTPVVTVPEWSLAFLILVPMIPYLLAAIWRRRRLAGAVASTCLGVIFAVSMLAAQVVPTTAAPDVFYLHDTGVGYSGASWYDADWQYRQPLAIDNTKVSGTSNLSYFPVLVSMTNAAWADTGSGGHVEQSDGGDILFTDSSGTKLDHEIERYVNTSGELIAWVEVPTVSYNSDTDIYMYYGNSTGVANQWNINGTWDGNGANNYKGVWHLNQVFTDSTSYGNNGTNNGTTDSAGKIAQGRDLENYSTINNQYISVADSTSFDISSQVTVEAWINPESINRWETIVSKMRGTTEDLYFVLDDTSDLYVGLQGVLTDWDSLVTCSAGSWQHVAVTFNGTTVTVYRNGSYGNSVSASGTLNIGTGANPLFMGYNQGWTNEQWDGQLDEVRISNTARSGDWIATEYANQNLPSSFFRALTSEETADLTPAGRLMNITEGSSATTLTFNSSGQTAYWYQDIAWPTGSGDATIAAGDYTANLYFNSLPGSGGFPQVATTNTSITSSASTNLVVSLPSGIQSGDLLIAMVSAYRTFGTTAINISWPAGWTEYFEQDATTGTAPHLAISGAWRKADGTEGASVTATSNVTVTAAHNSYRITGAADPTVQPPEVQTIGYTTASATIDPPSLTPTGGAKNYLWLAVAGWRDTALTATGSPGSYTNAIEANSGGTSPAGTRLRSLRRQLNASSENPSAFTLSAATSDRRAGATIAIHPAAAGSVDITVYAHHTDADGSNPQLITSASTTIDSGTSDPLALDLGNDPIGQTFASADPQLLRLTVEVTGTSGNGSFTIDYDGTCASSSCSSLDTPVVTVPEPGLGLIGLALTLPALAAEIRRRRKTRADRRRRLAGGLS